MSNLSKKGQVEAARARLEVGCPRSHDRRSCLPCSLGRARRCGARPAPAPPATPTPDRGRRDRRGRARPRRGAAGRDRRARRSPCGVIAAADRDGARHQPRGLARWSLDRVRVEPRARRSPRPACGSRRSAIEVAADAADRRAARSKPPDVDAATARAIVFASTRAPATSTCGGSPSSTARRAARPIALTSAPGHEVAPTVARRRQRGVRRDHAASATTIESHLEQRPPDGTITRLTDGPGATRSPALSPDGDRARVRARRACTTASPTPSCGASRADRRAAAADRAAAHRRERPGVVARRALRVRDVGRCAATAAVAVLVGDPRRSTRDRRARARMLERSRRRRRRG